MLFKIKTLLGITDNSKNDLLQVLIDQSTNQALQFTRNPKCIPCIEDTIIEMVIFNYNRLGTSGIASEGYSGVSFNYLSDYPEAIMRVLRAKRKVGTV